jgi:hypothetical protein
MKEKRRAYIGQDVYIGRPGRLPDVECCHLVFLYGCIIPTEQSTTKERKESTQPNYILPWKWSPVSSGLNI